MKTTSNTQRGEGCGLAVSSGAKTIMNIKRQWKLALSLVAACIFSAPALSQTKPVLVVNGSGQPVPTAAQGTTTVAGTVNVGNAPNVNVTNTPSVNVANTPSVSVANTPTVTLATGASINVTSPQDGQGNPTPLAVLEAVHSYEDACGSFFGGNAFATCTFNVIPSGKRLIIQEFDAGVSVDASLKPVSVSLGALSNAFIYHSFTTTFMGGGGGGDSFATHQETRLYASPNSHPNCVVLLTGNSVGGQLSCQLSGYLVDVP